MGKHAEWASGAKSMGRRLSVRFPACEAIIREILEELRDNPEAALTVPDIHAYLVRPKKDGGAGLVDGETAPNVRSLQNWVHAGPLRPLWDKRRNKAT